MQESMTSAGPSVPAADPNANADDPNRLRTSLLIGLCCLLVYNINGRAISAGDTYPARYLPFAILQYHTLYLDPVAKVVAQGRGDTAFWMLPLPDGHFISLYPVVQAVLITPLYVPAVAALRLMGWTDARLDYVAKVMEKISASLVASLSASLLYLLLRRRTTAPIALLLTLAYAFGTTTWVISSQALWQHGMGQLLVIGTLLFLTGSCTATRVMAAGLLCGLVAANRPPDVILAAALGAYGLYWAGPRRAALFAGSAAFPAGLVLLYNLAIAGNVLGGYGRMGDAGFFEHGLASGVAGLLFSPTRGLFVFSPFLLFLVLVWRHLPRDRKERGLTLAMGVAVVIQLLLYAKADWRGGVSWGPRFMTDLTPMLIWMLVPVVAALRSVGRALFLLAVSVAVVLEAVGAFCYNGVTDAAIFAVDGGPQKMRAAWNWRNAPFLSFTHGLAPADLATGVRGSFDAIHAGGRVITAVTAGQEVVATGWALAGHATPLQVAVVIDGKKTITSRTFHDRADVRDTLLEASPAGWRIPIDTAALTPGEHSFTAFASASEWGEKYYLEERKLTVEEPAKGGVGSPSAGQSLDDHFRTAASRIRGHQQPDGFWLTDHTTGTRFHDPHPEMNIFLTALMIDLLEPAATTGGLRGNLHRARRHLTRQIESGGLVRYHGLPAGPGIGTLGCAITPDVDDTALVWRLAPAEDGALLSTALKTIDRYRTRDGLYRTWLAPVNAYQCLNPGSDPNPADLTIQLHLLLLLSEVRPPAGRALCRALRPVVDDDRVWVYYRKAPLVAMLRMNDVRRTGCELVLPESRMRTEVPGQDVWISAARLLERAKIAGRSRADAANVRALLLKLARDDFALLRTNPPLLYHNDLTATVSRYYWSVDVGYALWLRLYQHR